MLWNNRREDPSSRYTAMSELLRDPEIDRLVEELNRGGPEPRAAAQDALDPRPRLAPARLSRVEEGDPLEALLLEMVRQGASDLLIVPERPPVFRIDGRLVAANRPPLEEEEVRVLFAAFSGDRVRQQLETEGSADFSLRL